MSAELNNEKPIGRKRFLQLSLLSWVAMIGVDFLIHAGIFSGVYLEDSPFLLPAMEAFRRIPLGYLTFLFTAGLLVWIMDRTAVRGWQKGLLVGLTLGAVMGTISTLGLFSISTASLQLLAIMFIAQVIEMAAAGAIIGQGLLVPSLRRLTLAVVIGFVILLVGTIVLQNI